MSEKPPTNRTRIRRVSERANYNQAAIHAVLDEALFGTIAFNDGLLNLLKIFDKSKGIV